MKLSILTVITLLLFAGAPAFAQIPELERPQVTPPSPEAAELTKYITYPVNLSNGLVQTSIPLYEIVDGDIRIPITLNYHASGLKPNMRSGHWLGDGWSLSTGPSLSRTINGVADEINYNPNMALGGTLSYEQLDAIYSQSVDVALDEFHYSLPGSQGRLYLRRNTDGSTTPVTIPRDDITVIPLGGNKSMTGFRITDNSGMTYSFGGGGRSNHDYVMHKFGISALEVPTSWKIREIRSAATGRTVAFEYGSNMTEIFCSRYADALIILDDFSGQNTYTFPLVNVSTCQSNDSKVYRYDQASGGLVEADMAVVKSPQGYSFPMPSKTDIIQNNSHVRSITFSGGSVLFNMNADTNKGLESIEIRDVSGTLVRRIVFNQTYMRDFFSLRLESVRIESPDGKDSETYSFSYKGGLMPRNTRSIDRWGFYNGRENHTLVPTVTTEATVNNFPRISESVTLTIPGGDRTPNEEAMQTGILSSVTYPTGGRTEFTYEAHRYIDDNGVSRMAGGLRIKQIRDIESDGYALYRNFRYSTYTSTVNGGGILNVVPAASSYPADTNEIYYRETTCTEFSGSLPSPWGTYKERVWTDNSMVNLLSSEGSSVSYPYVFESRSSDAAGRHTIGETVHSFDVSTSHPIKTPGTNLVHDTQNEWRYGAKTSETDYATDGDGSARMVRRKSNGHTTELDYGTEDTAIKQTYVYKSGRVYGIEESRVQEQYKEIRSLTTTLSQGRRLLSSVTEKAVETNGTLTKTTSFTHDARGNVATKTEDVGLPGLDRRVTVYSYPQDKTGGTYPEMVSSGMTGIPVETRVYRNSADPANLLTTLTTSYSSHPCASGSFIAPSARSLTIRGDASSERRILLNEYDRRGNPLEVVDTDGRKTAYLWGYNGYYPVAEVSGIGWDGVKDKVDTAVLNGVDEREIRKQLFKFRLKCRHIPETLISSYLYKPLAGLTYVKDPSDRITYYDYDGLGRLSLTSVRGASGRDTVSTYSYSYGAAAGGNRIRARDYLSGDGTAYIETNTYHDRLGRPIETVQTAASPDGKDIVTLNEYDSFGRPYSVYRPVPTQTSSGAYASFASINPELLKFYNWEVYTFSKTLYEDSPLDRPVEEYGPGSPWHTRGKSVRTEYLVNEATGALSCGLYLVSSDTSLIRSGVFPSGSLSIVKTTDEDGDVTLSFTDRLGRKVLERWLDGDLRLDTHYVYDDLGLTRYVLTPEATAATSSDGTFGDSSAQIAGLAYVYKYDDKGRCSSKKLPGRSPVLYKYDNGDSPVFSQDGRMRERGEWMFSFRDALGREAVSGIWPSSLTPDADGMTVIATYTGTASLGGYSVNIQTPAVGVPLFVNYYDDHSFLENLQLSDADRLALSPDTLSAYGVPVTGSDWHKGLHTGSAVRSVTDPESVTVSAFYYDRRGRQIQSHHLEALGGRRHVHQSLTFTGKPLRTRETVELPDGRADSLVTSRLYDSQERLVSETSSLNGRSQTVTYSYDGISRLTGRSYSSGDGSHSLSESLSYDIRDQLTGLSSNVFSMSLRRQEPVLGATPRYNGNISEWEWSRGAGSEAAAWSLSYDGAGRLKDARRFAGGVSTNAFSERAVTYDRNGNILSLTRYGADTAVPEEALAYSYNGNMLVGVSNSGSSGGGGSYTHDANGNLTRDGLSCLDIEYDDLNLTSRVSSGDTTLAVYGHLADGTKICSVDGTGNGFQYRGSLIYAQTAGQSGSPVLTLDCALTSAGRIVRWTAADGSVSYRSLIHLRDHLGSVRAVVDGDTGTVLEANDYYPFGKRIPTVTEALSVTEPVEVTSNPNPHSVASTSSTTAPTSPNRWHFSGKESQSFLSAAIPLLDFGARMYDPLTARWTAQDPLAEKYYAVSPYAYCLGNPIVYLDPNGKTITIFTIDDQNNIIHLNYEPNMQYNNGDSFATKIIDYLNSIYINGGKDAMDCLISASEQISIVNEIGKGNNYQFVGNKQGGGTIYAGSVLSQSYEQSLSVESLSHELFHGLQQVNGQGGASIFNEVEAYVFGYKVLDNYHSSLDTIYQNSPSGDGNSNIEGQKYQQAFLNLANGKDNYKENFKIAVSNFKKGARVNLTGLYDKFPIIKQNQGKYLLMKYYPK